MAGEPAVVVCGATGQQGGAVLEHLARGARFRLIALTRTPDSAAARKLEARGVQVLRADLLDAPSLVRAFDGAAAVFGITQAWTAGYKKVDGPGEVRQGINLIDACLAARVPHLVLSTAMQLEDKPTGLPHLDSKQEIEKYLRRKTTLPFTLLRPAMFMENIGLPFFPVKRGKLRGFIDSDAKLPMVSARDVGAAAVVALSAPEAWKGKTVDLVSDWVSGEELCRFLEAAHPGRTFKYTAPPRLLLRAFAPEFYKMRVGAEEAGRPPFPYAEKIDRALRETRAMVPGWKSAEQFVKDLPLPS